MIHNVYSIFDNKSLIYHPPWFQPTHGSATRVLADLVGDPNTQIGRHPGDFVLFHIGHYDDSKGQLVPLSPLVHICDAISLVKQMGDFFRQPVDLTQATAEAVEKLKADIC